MRFLVHAWRIDSHRAALESMRAERTGLPLSEANLPGVRQHALRCARLAQRSPSRQARDHLAKRARTWIKLAEDLERSHQSRGEEGKLTVTAQPRDTER